MKIKNFVAANMNEAIALVRQELGSEAHYPLQSDRQRAGTSDGGFGRQGRL